MLIVFESSGSTTHKQIKYKNDIHIKANTAGLTKYKASLARFSRKHKCLAVTSHNS